MARAGAVARGAVWNYSAQIITVLVQLGYAAATSRLLVPSDFGAYAAAFGSVQLITLLAAAGLPQVVGRMLEMDPRRLAGLLIWALVLGGTAAALTIATAPFWASVWGIPGVVGPITVLAAMVFLVPLAALANGVALRLGIFRRLAIRTVVANAGGMTIGMLAAAVLRTTESLAIAPILSQLGVAAMVLWACRSSFRGRPDWRSTIGDIGYSGKALVSALLVYSQNNVGRIAVGQSIGSVPLGNWNRADAITTNPFYLLGAAMAQAVFPELRHDVEDRTRTRRVWSDLHGLVGWVTVPLGALVAVLAPIAAQVLLGDGWSLAASYATVLAVLGAVQPVAWVLVVAFEALGRFSWVWRSYLAALVVDVAGAAAALATRDIWFVFGGIGVSYVVVHVVNLIRAHRAGLVDARRVLRHHAEITAFSLLLAAVAFTAVHLTLVIAVSPVLPWLVLVTAVVAVIVIARRPHRFPPVRIAEAYGLLPSRHRTPVDA